MAQSARMGSIGLHHVNIVPQSILESPGVTTTLACMMDLHYYPLDHQNCSTVEIESYKCSHYRLDA